MSRRTLIAVVLPLVAIGLGILRAELGFARARDVMFEITGFDPRDLLRGHYLQFRLALEPIGTREICDPTSQSCCLCVSARAGAAGRAEHATCATAQTACDAWLERDYASQPLRYYVPESRASELERRLQSAMTRHAAHAVLAIGDDGQAYIRELRIDGEAIPGAVER